MAKGNFGEWVDRTLYPAMYSRLDEVFPTMHFVKSGTKWISPRNIDGTEPKNRKRDKTFVLESVYHLAQENGEHDSRDLITLFQELNNIADRIHAIKEIAKILSLDVPEGNSKEWEERKKVTEALALSYDRQKRALFSPEGAETLKYLKETRGYDEPLIRTMGLGYLSPSEAKYLDDNFKVGFNWRVEQYPLSIAHFSNGDIVGFNCRCISKEVGENWGKYRRTTNLNNSVNNNPFGITPNNLNQIRKKGEVVIVEGELDALHAIALGLPNVVAASTGNISRGKVETLKKYKYENVVILLDADGAGEAGTEKSILTISDEGLNAFVATIPDGKDTDEFLQRHSIEELKEVVNNANFGELWLYFKEREKFEQTEKTDIDKSNFLRNYIKIASRQKSPTKRERLYSYLLREFHDVDITSIEKGIREEVENNVADEENEGSVTRAYKNLQTASTSITEEGNTLEGIDTLQDALKTIKADGQRENALRVIKEGTELLSGEKVVTWETKKKTITDLKGAVKDLKEAAQEDTFASLLKDNTEELWESYKEANEALKTKFSFFNNALNEYYDLSFPSGAISIIGAQTNHGKSKVLQSIALDTIESMEEGETILYITYEESEGSINAQFLNSFFNDTLTRKGARGSNLKTIVEYLTKGDKTYMSGETIDKFLDKEKEWKAIRRKGMIKIVRPEDNYLQTLTSLILFATKKLRIKAIFIDYVQEIYVEDWSKYSRTDELKQAMVELDTIAQRTNLPIIMAAQLSKEAVSPLDLYNQFIADSSWIGRKASEIILIWSNKFDIQAKSRQEKADKEDRMLREIPGFSVGENRSGKLYLKITKSRIIPTGSYTIVDIDANTGRVKGNLDEVETERKRTQKPVQTSFISNKPKEAYKPQDDNVKIDPEAQRPYRGDRDEEEETEAPDSTNVFEENKQEPPF